MNTEQQFQQLVSDIHGRFGDQPLSAIDNMKLLTSILNADNKQADAFTAKRICEQQKTIDIYCIKWASPRGVMWIDCGACNSYSCTYTLMSTVQLADIEQIEPINVAILPVEQLGLLFMQYAHFDHC